jgi:hypothetical protein
MPESGCSFTARFLFPWLVFLAFCGSARAQALLTPAQLQKAIPARMEHPYLYFSKADLPAIKERLRSDPRSAQVWNRILLEGNRTLLTPLPPEPARQNNGRFSNDGVYDGYVNKMHEGGFLLSFLYAMTGERKYADKAWLFVDALCNQPTWVLRPHEFPVIEGRMWPWGVDSTKEQVVFSFDHVTGDISRDMAAMYDWLYNGLDRVQRNRIRCALLENCILRVRNAYAYHWWAWSYRCNWCCVCNSGLGLAALALYDENPEMADVVAESHGRIMRTLDQITPEGGWQEGVGYWNYALRTAQYFMVALKRATQGKVNMFDHPKLKVTFDFPLWSQLPPQSSINFEDSDGKGIKGNWSFYMKYAEETGSPAAYWLAGQFAKADSDPFSLIWKEATAKTPVPNAFSKHFSGIDWVVFRTQWLDENVPVLAAKAGIHDDPHHGHLDAGTFLFHYRGESLIRDAGRPVYDEQVFDTSRWSVPYCNSLGHNVVIVNGELQLPGSSHFGKVEAFTTGDKTDYTRMDLTRAYSGRSLKGWKRHIVFHKPSVFVLLDEVQSAPGSEVKCRFHPGGAGTVDGSAVLIKGRNGMAGILVFSADPVAIMQGADAYLAMQADAKMDEVPFLDAVVTGKEPQTNVITLIVPVENENQWTEIRKKAKVTFSKGELSYVLDYHGVPFSGSFTLSSKGAQFKEGK